MRNKFTKCTQICNNVSIFHVSGWTQQRCIVCNNVPVKVFLNQCSYQVYPNAFKFELLSSLGSKYRITSYLWQMHQMCTNVRLCSGVTVKCLQMTLVGRQAWGVRAEGSRGETHWSFWVRKQKHISPVIENISQSTIVLPL